jgi:hypothetical protein
MARSVAKRIALHIGFRLQAFVLKGGKDFGPWQTARRKSRDPNCALGILKEFPFGTSGIGTSVGLKEHHELIERGPTRMSASDV